MAYQMSLIDLNKFDGEVLEYATAITSNRKGETRLRASKPTKCGKAAYVWRMVAFSLSKNPQHQCMPVCADFDIKAGYDERREICKHLDTIVDEIVRSVPINQWHGITRWGRAMGMMA